MNDCAETYSGIVLSSTRRRGFSGCRFLFIVFMQPMLLHRVLLVYVCVSVVIPPPTHTHTPLQTHTPPPHGQFSHQSIFCSGAPRPVNPSSVCVCVPLINIFTSPRSEMILSSSLQPSSIGVRGGCSQRIRRRSESWAAVTTADWQPAPYILRAVGQIDASERGSCHRLTLAVICCRVFVCNLHRRLLSRR